jgi:hypothetical protein
MDTGACVRGFSAALHKRVQNDSAARTASVVAQAPKNRWIADSRHVQDSREVGDPGGNGASQPCIVSDAKGTV